MNYQIKIVRFEPNLNYEEDLKKSNNRNDYYRNETMHVPEAVFTKDVLICELTEEQFKKMREEVLKVF